MGIISETTFSLRTDAARSLNDALFTRSQQRVLGILFGQPERSFHVNEIIELANIGRGAVSRELSRLRCSRIAKVTRNGRRKLYQANPESAVFPELCSLVNKTLGFANSIREALQPCRAKIDFAFIYGSVAKGMDTATSDIDLLAVSDHLHSFELNVPLFPAMHDLGRQIELHHYTQREFSSRNRSSDCFLRRVLDGPTIFVVGSMETVHEICRT